ncbi:peptidase M24, structural domain-containing protein [Hyaloraphidium curvatum]|nr:peptidase M24, structural domain-containing protein [Hyaloraphidium curvatum]
MADGVAAEPSPAANGHASAADAGDASDPPAHPCSLPGCPAPARQKCPTCLELALPPAYFCSQEHFKLAWKEHKLRHASKPRTYDPFPSHVYSGKIRAVYDADWKPLRIPRRAVPDRIAKPDWYEGGIAKGEERLGPSTQIEVLKPGEIQKMRRVCRLSREVLEEGAKAAKVGATTLEIDRVVHEAAIERDCYPSPLNYYHFPRSCCTSVNEIICHGIPDLYELQDGDILNIDVSLFHDGFHGDLNDTYCIGNVDEAGRNLVRVTRECLDKAIEIVKPGVQYRDIGPVIAKHANAHNYAVVKTYCGHGIGRHFHSPPSVPHTAKNKAVGTMRPGHVFTIEPMINESKNPGDKTWPDKWTSTTLDGKRSAQFEETILVTETGCEVLTAKLP